MMSKIPSSLVGCSDVSLYNLKKGEGDVIEGSIDVLLRSKWKRYSSSIGSPFQEKGASVGGARRIFFFQRIVEVFIDTLCQLRFKFIEKSEVTHFNFQRRFLAPVLFIMEDLWSKLDLRELVIQFIDNIPFESNECYSYLYFF